LKAVNPQNVEHAIILSYIEFPFRKYQTL
jgi:hypothetical protein